MPDPRVKIPTKPVSMRLELDVKDKLQDLAKKYKTPQVQVINTLVRDAHKHFVDKRKT
jgi:predicted transcriptional regulator